VKLFGALLCAAVASAQADIATPRADANSRIAHQQLLEKAARGGIDIYFEGDSITRRWGATDYPELLANWNQNFFGWNAADFGWGADRVENILWRLENGELDGVNPKVMVLLAGTNNVGNTSAAEITKGLTAVVRTMQAKAPKATLIVTAIFPRYDSPTAMPVIDAVNAELAKLPGIRFVNINAKLDASLLSPDKLHPALPAYQVWADALKPIFAELLGPAAQTDHAPPPTGDPSKTASR
jgi:lysophospholipase L1-like esterase